MKIMTNTMMFIGILLLTCSCASLAPTPQELATADYGEKPSDEECLAKLKEYGERVLIDPMSAMYYTGISPFKGWARIKYSAPIYGWIFSGQINSKNRMGGYVGRREFIMLYNKGSVIPITYDHSTYDGSPFNYPYGRM